LNNFFILGVGIELELSTQPPPPPLFILTCEHGNTWELGEQVESILSLTIGNMMGTLKSRKQLSDPPTPSPLLLPHTLPHPPLLGAPKWTKKKVGPLGCMLSLLIGYVNFLFLE